VFTAGTVGGRVMFALLMSVTFLFAGVLARSPGLHADAVGACAHAFALSSMMVVTPIVGRTYNVLSPPPGGQLRPSPAWRSDTVMMSHYTLATSERGIVVCAIGVRLGCFSCLFVPLAPRPSDRIPRHNAGRGAGLKLGGASHRRLDIGLAEVICHSAHRRHMTTFESVARHPMSVRRVTRCC